MTNSTPHEGTELVLIAALARNRVIGRDNRLLWHLPQDMARFRRLTQGCPVVMGRLTWESLPPRFRPLPGRRNVVLSRQSGLSLPGADVFGDLASALSCLQGAPRVFIIGGAQIYAQALPLAHRLELTELHADFEGDAHFPEWRGASLGYAETVRERWPSEGPDRPAFDFVTYRRAA